MKITEEDIKYHSEGQTSQGTLDNDTASNLAEGDFINWDGERETEYRQCNGQKIS